MLNRRASVITIREIDRQTPVANLGASSKVKGRDVLNCHVNGLPFFEQIRKLVYAHGMSNHDMVMERQNFLSIHYSITNRKYQDLLKHTGWAKAHLPSKTEKSYTQEGKIIFTEKALVSYSVSELPGL